MKKCSTSVITREIKWKLQRGAVSLLSRPQEFQSFKAFPVDKAMGKQALPYIACGNKKNDTSHKGTNLAILNKTSYHYPLTQQSYF